MPTRLLSTVKSTLLLPAAQQEGKAIDASRHSTSTRRRPSLASGPSTPNSCSSTSRGVLRHRQASMRALHCTEQSTVPKARKITFASGVFVPVQQARSRLDIWGPEEFDIGHTVPMRAACGAGSSCPSTPPYGSPDSNSPSSRCKSKKKVPQTIERLEARLRKVVIQVDKENVVLQALCVQAYKLTAENELIGRKLTKYDLVQEHHLKIAAVVHNLQQTVDKYTSKIKFTSKEDGNF